MEDRKQRQYDHCGTQSIKQLKTDTIYVNQVLKTKGTSSSGNTPAKDNSNQNKTRRKRPPIQ